MTRNWKYRIALVALLFSAVNAHAQRIPDLGAGTALIGSNVFPAWQGTDPAVKITSAQIATYVYSLASGDATISGAGVVTLPNVNANTGAIGGATSCVTVTNNAKGLTTAVSAVTCTPALGSITGFGTSVVTALALNLNASGALLALTPVRAGDVAYWNGSTWTSFAGNNSGTNCFSENSTGVPAWAACSGGGGTPGGTSGQTQYNNAGSFGGYTPGGDCTVVVSTGVFTCLKTNGVSFAASATTDATNAANISSGTLPAGRLPALTGDCTTTIGTVATSCPKTGGVAFGALATATPGTGVAAAAAVALSGAGGLASTIASGTATLGTSAIASGACASVVTVSAPNVATTDVVSAGYNTDPTAITGYGASATGAVLSVYPYPTAGNFNVKVCNSTASSITPSAMTVNLKAVR